MVTELKWGVIFSLVSLGWVTAEYLAGFHDRSIASHAIVSVFFMVPAVGMMYLAIREKRRLAGGRIGFVAALLCGIGVSVTVAVLAPLQEYIFHRLINPNFFERMIEYSTGSGKMTMEQARSYFTLRSYMMQSSMGAIGMGWVTSVVLAFLMRERSRGGQQVAGE